MNRKYLSVLVPALYPVIVAAMVLLVRQKTSDKVEIAAPSSEARSSVASTGSAEAIPEKLP